MPQRSTRHGGQGARGVSGRASDLTAWRIWQVVDVPVATQRNSQELAATAITQQMAEKVENGKQKEKQTRRRAWPTAGEIKEGRRRIG